VRRILIASFLAVLVFAILGCNGGRETDEITYVVTLGIDAAPDGLLNVTYRMARPAALGGEAGKGGGETTEIITITAPSLAVARDLLNSQVERSPNLSHIKVIIVGEELARHGLANTIVPIIRFREFRGSSFFLVAYRTTAENIIRTNKPVIEKLVSRWTEGMMGSAGESGYYQRTFLHNFLVDVKAGSGSPYATLIGIDPLAGHRHPSAGTTAGEKSEEFLPGGTPRRGGNPVVLIGTALFSGDKMVGVLTNEETRMLSILTDQFHSGFLTVDDPLVPGLGVNVRIRPGRAARIDVRLADTRPVLEVDVLLEVEISALASGVNYETAEYNKLLEDRITEVIRHDMVKTITYTQRLGVDPVNFGRALRPRFSTYEEFRRFGWDEIYPTADVDVKVKTIIRRTGLMRQTSPIRYH
jgi:spore germination protein KC